MLGDDITVKFTALKTAKISNRQSGGLSGGLDDGLANEILKMLRNKSHITQKDLSAEMDIPLRTLQRIMKKLMEEGIVERKGGKRFGYWMIVSK